MKQTNTTTAKLKHPIKQRLQVLAPVLQKQVTCNKSMYALQTLCARQHLIKHIRQDLRSPNRWKTKSRACRGRVDKNTSTFSEEERGQTAAEAELIFDEREAKSCLLGHEPFNVRQIISCLIILMLVRAVA
jgi:hypothetical protein